jgi:hypothetical protein
MEDSNVYYDLAANDVAPILPLGTEYIDNATLYKYRYYRVSAASANASSAGRVFAHTTTAGEISDDVSEILTGRPAGIGLGTVAKANYGFFATEIYSTSIKHHVTTGVSTAIGDSLVVSPVQDGCAKIKTAVSAITKPTIGIVSEVVTGLAATCSAYIKIV